MRLKRQSIPILVCLTGMFIAFQNCGRSHSTLSPGIESLPVTTPTPNIANNDVDPWNAPVAELVEGATLYDGWTDLRVLPEGVNITGGWTDSVAISNDGKSLYFVYSKLNFAHMTDTNGAEIIYDGPTRPGMTGNHMKNFKAVLTKDGWQVSIMSSPFNTDPNVHESSLSPNATENLIVWAKWDANYKASVYYSYKNSDGSWAPAEALPSPINNPNCSNDNPFVVGDLLTGVDIYWESDRTDLACTGGQGKRHIYHSYYNPTNNTFTPARLVPGINGTNAAVDEDAQFFVTKDKKQAFWTAVRSNDYALYTADLVGNAYMNVRPVVRGTTVAPFTGKLMWLGEINTVELPQGWLAYFMCAIATRETGNSKGMQLKVCRMKKPKTAETEAAKKINTAGWSDSPYISRDGQRLYFMYSRWDFAPWIKSGGTQMPVVMGPDRAGLNKDNSNPFNESDIYVSYKNLDGTWGEPVNLGLNGPYGDASGMEYNNGNSFLWQRGDGVWNYIYTVTKNADGTWGTPTKVPNVNSNNPHINDNPFISEDGNNMYIVSDRAGGQGGKDLWFSTKSGGNWITPINIGVTFNSTGDEDQPFIPNGGLSTDIYWNGPMGIMHCVSNGSGCSATPTVINIANCDHEAEVSIPDDGKTMYFGCGNLTTGRVDIRYSIKQSDGSWGPAIPVD